MAYLKKRSHGPSLYYATDKNVFDALNQHKVDSPTVEKLFLRRNVLVSRKTPRADLASYFSRLTHDYYDHKEIAARLGVASRRERTASIDVSGIVAVDDIQAAIEKLKVDLESTGDVVHVSRDGEDFSVQVKFTEIDYKRSEFTQVQVKDGTLTFVKEGSYYVVRNTQNDYLTGARDAVLSNIESNYSTKLSRGSVSLFDVPSSKLRSKFFHSLSDSLPGFTRQDVTDVFIYKAKPEADGLSLADSDVSSEDGEIDTHVDRVTLRGNGVARAKVLNDLLDEESYHIVRMGWIVRETMGGGHVYDLEAAFSEPKDCAGFSFILNGVFPLEDGKISQRRRTPQRSEIEMISRVIEKRARSVVEELRTEYAATCGGK
jgi:hypothetical protein